MGAQKDKGGMRCVLSKRRVKERAKIAPESSSKNESEKEEDEGPGPEFMQKPGMRELVDNTEIQGWTCLFSWPILMLYEKKVRDFYYNM